MVEVLQQAQVRKILQDVIGGCDNQTATVLEVTFAQLYTANEGKHKFHGTNASGILAFLIDRREGKSYYLRLYDAANLQVLFSIELCYQFKDYWTQVAGIPNFYCIPIFNGYCGFLFPNTDEATKITTKINSMAPKKDDYERIVKENKEIEDAKKKAEKAEKEKHTVTGKLKNFFGGDKKDDGPQIIGDPKNFQHKMIFNLETGEIDVEKLPPQLVEVFKKAGITKKDLQDKKQAVEIFKAVAQFNENPSQLPPVAPPPQQQQQQQPQTNKGAPPPPPPPKAPAPPPPPPPKGLPPPPPKAAGGPSSGQAAQAPQAPKPSTGGRSDLLAEIQKGVQLKPVNKTDVEVKVNDMNNQQKDDLSSYLGQMIAIRRTELTKGKKDDSESDNGGWSDDD